LNLQILSVVQLNDEHCGEEILAVFDTAFGELLATDPASFRVKFPKMAASAFAFYRGTACLPDSYRVKDVVGRRGIGIGSAGLPSYNLLLEGHTDALENDVVIHIKQPSPRLSPATSPIRRSATTSRTPAAARWAVGPARQREGEPVQGCRGTRWEPLSGWGVR
jgi:uncharacterized protein (DUF2252 family)